MSLHGGRTTGQTVTQSRRWSRSLRKVMSAGWASFLTACIASVLFFAVFDPARLADAADWQLEFSRMAGYAILFFFFWAIGIGAASTTLILMRREHRNDVPGTKPDRD